MYFNIKMNGALFHWSISNVIHLFLVSVLCFSACSTIFSSTWSPFLLRTPFMYFRALFCVSDFSPKSAYSSSVVGTQNGSISMTWINKVVSISNQIAWTNYNINLLTNWIGLNLESSLSSMLRLKTKYRVGYFKLDRRLSPIGIRRSQLKPGL